MSDTAKNDETGGGKVMPWTEAEKYQFLLKIINNLAGDKSVKLSDINMPGRTTKSLTHQWAKIRADAAAAAAHDEDGDAPKVTKAPVSRKRKAPELDDQGNPVKKTRTSRKKTGDEVA